jgi:predicted TIM-barrel fold metal-dependent hydrolase
MLLKDLERQTEELAAELTERYPDFPYPIEAEAAKVDGTVYLSMGTDRFDVGSKTLRADSIEELREAASGYIDDCYKAQKEDGKKMSEGWEDGDDE